MKCLAMGPSWTVGRGALGLSGSPPPKSVIDLHAHHVAITTYRNSSPPIFRFSIFHFPEELAAQGLLVMSGQAPYGLALLLIKNIVCMFSLHV